MEMIGLFEQWKANGWRSQLISRLNDDTDFCDSDSDPSEFLLALGSISDELDTEGTVLDGELVVANRLWFKRFSKLEERGKIPFIEKMFKETRGVSIPLLVLEQLRERNQVTFSPGAKAKDAIPTATDEEIEELTMLLLPQVKKRFLNRRFPISGNSGHRLYRLAHAIGPDRLESILRTDLAISNLEASWAISTSVLSNLILDFGNDLLEPHPNGSVAGKAFVDKLTQFASIEFWKEFLELAEKGNTLEKKERNILCLISSGIASTDEDDLAE